MQVSVDEIGVTKIRQMEFLIGDSISDRDMVYCAPLDKKRGPKQRWIVIYENHHLNEDGCIAVYTTEEMRLLYRCMKDANGQPVKARKEIGYHFLVRAGKLRMKIRNGCAGCRRFWGGDCSEGQCSKCHRCYACCGKKSVPFSCASGQEAKEGSYVRKNC